ncbi:PIR protein [Plasmodium vivax]|uniref:VIR protein n=1 Tax=Plasmodium vivax TaxID=5855 RepID=A0A565A3Q5_PLAVI|nr:PIR protein [Plasmodium vivax]
MSDDILDIANWKIDYSFLKNVSDLYDKYNSNEYDDAYRNLYAGLCDTIIKNSKGDVEKHKDICMKLMRNLGYFSVDPNVYQLTRDHCNVLYNWIYNLINKNKITDNVINKCFEVYYDVRNVKENDKQCDYYRDIIIYDPIKITLLDIFNDNTPTIKDTLINQYKSSSTPCRKFVCKCVQIYKQMNDTYCSIPENIKKHESTCLKLSLFKDSYDTFRNIIGPLNSYIPSLDNIDDELLVKCPLEKQNKVLTPKRAENSDSISGIEKSTTARDQDRTFTDASPSPHELVDSSMKKNITTTVGALAGASSVLALLYRFTPAGRLVNPRLRRIGGRTNNNFFSNGESELLFDEFAQGNINSYNIGYEAA